MRGIGQRLGRGKKMSTKGKRQKDFHEGPRRGWRGIERGPPKVGKREEDVHEGAKKIYEHRCTGCTGLTGRKLPAREADSGNDRVWICGCSGLQASRFLKKSCASCASMLITQSNDGWNSGRQAPETKSCRSHASTQITAVTHEAAGSSPPGRPRASPWSRRLPLQWGVAEAEPSGEG